VIKCQRLLLIYTCNKQVLPSTLYQPYRWCELEKININGKAQQFHQISTQRKAHLSHQTVENNEATTYVFGNSCLGIEQAQMCGTVKPVKGINFHFLSCLQNILIFAVINNTFIFGHTYSHTNNTWQSLLLIVLNIGHVKVKYFNLLRNRDRCFVVMINFVWLFLWRELPVRFLALSNNN
jgi:hypothetical protein